MGIGKAFIGFLIITFAACVKIPKAPEPVEEPTPTELSAVDSLMWQRPDSALAMIVDYFTGRDGVHTVSTRYDLHYAHLLLAELLYKNDHPQTNRAELQQAVAYYDSLMVATDGSDAIISFLDARAHYINGVGYYESDSIRWKPINGQS